MPQPTNRENLKAWLHLYLEALQSSTNQYQSQHTTCKQTLPEWLKTASQPTSLNLHLLKTSLYPYLLQILSYIIISLVPKLGQQQKLQSSMTQFFSTPKLYLIFRWPEHIPDISLDARCFCLASNHCSIHSKPQTYIHPVTYFFLNETKKFTLPQFLQQYSFILPSPHHRITMITCSQETYLADRHRSGDDHSIQVWFYIHVHGPKWQDPRNLVTSPLQ